MNQLELDNHANQLNPNNIEYYRSRGYDERPDDYDNKKNDTLSDNDYYEYFNFDIDYSSSDDEVIFIKNKNKNKNNFIPNKTKKKKKKKKKFYEESLCLKNLEIMKRYKIYPYLFVNLDGNYGDSHLSDFLFKEKKYIKMYFKLNNLPLIKNMDKILKKKYGFSNNYQNYVRSIEEFMNDPIISQHYRTNFSLEDWAFVLKPSENIINKIINKYFDIKLISNLDIFKKVNRLQRYGTSPLNQLMRIDKDKAHKFIDFLSNALPCILIYIDDNKIFKIVNENNGKTVLKLTLPKEYSNKKITNIAWLENDSILIELDKILLLEINIIDQKVKSYLP